MGASSTRVIALAEISEKIRHIEHMLEQTRALLQRTSPGTENQDTAIAIMMDMVAAHLESIETLKGMLEKAREG